MSIGNLAIQCTAKTGEVGSFLYVAQPGVSVRDSQLLTPVFPGLAQLYPYLKANGWTQLDVHAMKYTRA